MKVQLFKNLIKEAVREVLQEEMKEILSEYSFSSNQVIPPPSPPQNSSFTSSEPNIRSAGTPKPAFSTIEKALLETKQSMTSSDYKNIVGGSGAFLDPVSSIGVNSSLNEQVPTVGLDISQLDFVKKAASVYKLSNEKKMI